MSGPDAKAAGRIAQLAGIGFMAARARLARAARDLAGAEAALAAHMDSRRAGSLPADASDPPGPLDGAQRARWLMWHALRAAALGTARDRARVTQAGAREAAALALARARAADFLAARSRAEARRAAEARADRALPPQSGKKPLSPGS